MSNNYEIELKVELSEQEKDALVTKKLIEESLKELLERERIVEAPGMFTMAFKKL